MNQVQHKTKYTDYQETKLNHTARAAGSEKPQKNVLVYTEINNNKTESAVS